MTSTSAFSIGDKVRFNHHCGTEYLQSKTAVVTDVGTTRITIKLDQPVGRFVQVSNGISQAVEVDVPPTIVDRVK